MPYRDQSGPEGLGPLTGRGAGSCSGIEAGFIGRPAGLFLQLGRRLFYRYGSSTRPRYSRFLRIGRGRNRRY